MNFAPDELKFLRDIDFIHLEQSQPTFWETGVNEVLEATEKILENGDIELRGGRRRVLLLCLKIALAMSPLLGLVPFYRIPNTVVLRLFNSYLSWQCFLTPL